MFPCFNFQQISTIKVNPREGKGGKGARGQMGWGEKRREAKGREGKGVKERK